MDAWQARNDIYGLNAKVGSILNENLDGFERLTDANLPFYPSQQSGGEEVDLGYTRLTDKKISYSLPPLVFVRIVE